MDERLTRQEAARLLGVTLPCGDGQLKRAYRRLAREHHPDRGGDARHFHELQRAYERLVADGDRAPGVSRGRPSRTPATAPHAPSADDLAALDLDAEHAGEPGPLDPDRFATLLASPHPGAVHPLLASSRSPGSRLNRAAGLLAAELTSTLEVQPTTDDRGRDVVVVEVTGASRRARRALEAASLDGTWVRRRRSTTTQLRAEIPPARDRRETAAGVAARTTRLLDALGWPLREWTVTARADRRS
ncbi:MAG: J domain-containing protein [Nitriliruptoraceae bacterium]